MRALNRNERLLAGALGALLILFVNLAGMRWVADQMHTEGAKIRQLEGETQAARLLMKQRPYWIARREWLDAHPPAIYDDRSSRSKFQQEVQAGILAQKLKIDSQQPLDTERSGDLAVANIDVVVSGRLEAIVRWLQAVQQPGRYMSLGNFTLNQSDDGNSMELQVRLGKVYRAAAPATSP
jgi:hypothetical protein